MWSPSPLCRSTVLLLFSLSFACARDTLQDRVNKDPLALLTHLHLRSAQDHRIPAFVITQVSHNPESIERSHSDEITVPVVLATTNEQHVRKPSARRHPSPAQMRPSEEPRNYEDLIARPYNAAEEETSPEARLRSSGRTYQAVNYRETVETSEPREVVHISREYAKHMEEASPATTTEATVTTTPTPSEATTVESIETTEAPREIIHSVPSYVSESSQSLGDDAKIPLLIPVRKRAPVTTQYTLVSSDGQGHEQPSYVSSDVYTIETTTKYRPRTMHSNSIFYQKALAYLKAYKKELVQRRPLGATYRLNANSDDPSHVVTAYGEIPPVVAESYASEGESPNHPSAGRANLYQQQEMEPASGPSSDESLAVTDRQREVIGYLPVVRLPRHKNPTAFIVKSEQNQETVPYASASASASSSSSLSSPASIDESSIMGKKPVSSSAASYLSPSLRLRKQSSARLIATASNKLHHRANRMSVPSPSASSPSSGYSPISSLLEPTFPVLTVSVKRTL